MIQDVYIIGATGKVGRELVEQIFKKGDVDPSRHPDPTRIVGLASSTHTLYLPEGISLEQAYAFSSKDYSHAEPYKKNNHGEFIERARYGFRDGGSTLVFIDATAETEPMIQFHKQVIRETQYGLVTANKNPIAFSDYDTFRELTIDVGRYGYRCSVMAGAEVIPFIRDSKDVNDPIYNVEGCFSGTNGFITSELEKFDGDGTSKRLSDVVREAYENGYTEPHPRDDLNGVDVARKLVIIARSIGLPVGMENVLIEPLIPEEYLKEDDVGRFLEGLVEFDELLEHRMAMARDNNLTLRYVANIDMRGEDSVLKVSLQDVPKDSLLGRLEGTANQVVITTGTFKNGYPIGPLPGAGKEETAQNIRRELLSLLPVRRDHI